MSQLKVKSVWDNDGESYDRYTVFFEGVDGECLALSSNPTHPLGFSQWCKGQEGEHLGKKLEFDKLPKKIQEHILWRAK